MNPLDQALAVRAPSDLSERATLSFDCHTELSWKVSARFGFDYHWIREAPGGTLDADFHVSADGAARSEVTVQWTGNARISVSLDERGRLRLTYELARRESPGAVRVRACPAELPGDGRPRELLDTILGIPDAGGVADEGLSSLAAFRQMAPQRRRAVIALTGAIRSERELTAAGKGLAEAEALCRRIYGQAAEALERKLAEELAGRLKQARASQPLLDCSFAFTGPGLHLYRRVLAGDLRELPAGDNEHAVVRASSFGPLGEREVRLELQMPYLKRRFWAGRLALFPGMKVAAEAGGALKVSAAEAAGEQGGSTIRESALMLAGSFPLKSRARDRKFSLSFTHRQSCPAAEAPMVLEPLLLAYSFGPETVQSVAELASRGGNIETEISLRLPGSAVSAWLQAPGEKSAAFYKAFVGVSTAIQQAHRLWFPYTYFDKAELYDDLEMALPLVVYRASKPFSRRARSEYTYDAMNLKSVRLAFYHARRGLPRVLKSVRSRLLAAGRPGTAARYAPENAKRIVAAVARGRKRFTSLLATDTSLVGEMVKLGNRGRLLRADSDGPASGAGGHVSHFLDRFTRSIDVRLRRGYGGRDFLSLGPILAIESTRALSRAFGGESNIESVLRVRVPDEGGERVYVNEACLQRNG